MSAVISGFTAWSSVREPSQVFTLLEQIYNSFDAIAKKRRIKVETIGDCYVAAAGLPEPRKDHAVAMACFAHDCRNKVNSVVQKLEVLLGPDTADLTMRFGLHSGPVPERQRRGLTWHARIYEVWNEKGSICYDSIHGVVALASLPVLGVALIGMIISWNTLIFDMHPEC
jgi:hypothetical protein